MAVKFAGTMNAINRGLETTKASKGADMVEDWEAALAEVDTPGAKGILRDLGSLRKQLEKDTPDEDRIRALLHRLGVATTKIADKSEKQGDKLKALGEALTEAGEAEPDEEEDAEAAAAPKRARKKAWQSGAAGGSLPMVRRLASSTQEIIPLKPSARPKISSEGAGEERSCKESIDSAV